MILWKDFAYNPGTGNLFKTYKESDGRGKILLNSKNVYGYCRFRYKRKTYFVARAIYELMTQKKIRKGMEIDYINGIRDDNNWTNLRLVTRRQNSHNKLKHRQGKLVGTHKVGKKFSAQIGINNKTKYLGRFKTEKEAHEAYMRAAKKFL